MFCRYCGAELQGPFCVRCGKPGQTSAYTAPPSAAQPSAAFARNGAGQANFWNPAESMRKAEESAPEIVCDVPQPSAGVSDAEPAVASASSGGMAGSLSETEYVGDFEDQDDLSFLLEPVPVSPGAAAGTPEGERLPENGKDKKKDRKSGKSRKINDGSVPQTQPDTKKNRREKKPLRFFTVFPAALAFFLPAVYFFFDLFVVYGNALTRKSASGLTALQQFIDWSTSPAYDVSSAAELMSGTFGESAQVVSLLSLGTLRENTEYLLPVAVALAAAALCLFAGVLILISGARILRYRVFLDLMTLFGLAAAFAPFTGESVYIFGAYLKAQNFTSVNRTMAAFGVTLESMLLMCICALFLIPAIRRLRRAGDAAAGRDYPVILPCAALGAKFFTAKLFTVLTVALCLVFPVLFLVGPVYTPELDLADMSIAELFSGIGETLRTVISGGESVNTWMTLLSLFAQILLALQVPLLAIACAPLLLRFFRILFTGRQMTAKESGREKSRPIGCATAEIARRLLMLPFVSFAVFGVVATLFLLFASHIALHLDFSDPAETLDTVYLVIAYVKSLGGTTCAYVLLMAAGAPLWHLAGNFHNAMEWRRAPKSSGAHTPTN